MTPRQRLSAQIAAIWQEYNDSLRAAHIKRDAGDHITYAWMARAAMIRREALLSALCAERAAAA